MSEAEYDQAVAELAAFARLHRALAGQPGPGPSPGHPWPSRDCLTCPWIERRRQDLTRPSCLR
jgi:hypothetical protein